MSELTLERRRITIAIMALGGQGGGVLADWILEAARHSGYVAQGTSVPGVAQRTGSTIYYIELVPTTAGQNRDAPVLALNPVPGDVDVVIASELMETGRAILRGFVSNDRTTLIGSTHRVYAISEKSAPGDGRASAERILAACERRAKRFIGFDMDAAALESGSVISSIMLGALVGSAALPISRDAFEMAIKAGGKAVTSNLKGFAAGIAGAEQQALPSPAMAALPEPTTPAGLRLANRIRAELPEPAYAFALEGVKRLLDYQDKAYAGLYLDRLASVKAQDNGQSDWALTAETARSLALWMAYDDVIRVADLKVRAARSERVVSEVQLHSGQLLHVTEYMHPRVKEVCETMPAAIGHLVLHNKRLSHLLGLIVAKGRHVETTSLRWFIALRFLSGFRRFRRGTLRFREENARIADWLSAITLTARSDVALATEIARNQRLIKGYGDTFDRGLLSFSKLMEFSSALCNQKNAALQVAKLRQIALSDESGCALDHALMSAN